MKKILCFLILACLSIGASCATQKEALLPTKQNENLIQNNEESSIPTLFIHGYGGGENSFGKLIARLEKEGITKKALVITVTELGEIKAKGTLSDGVENPSIQVIFESNKENEWHQAQWIKNCLVYLRNTYHTDEVNFVGHSMGGVSALRYMTMTTDEEALPTVKKFIAIAAPFNNFIELPTEETVDKVLENGPSIQSERYVDYATGIDRISTEMNVLLIAGDIEDGSLSDEAVAVTDALSVFSLFRHHGNKIHEKIIYGTNAQHSYLHENLEVDELITTYLWNN